MRLPEVNETREEDDSPISPSLCRCDRTQWHGPDCRFGKKGITGLWPCSCPTVLSWGTFPSDEMIGLSPEDSRSLTSK